MKNLIIFSSLLIFGIVFIVSNNSSAGLNHVNYKGAGQLVCIVDGGEYSWGGGVRFRYLDSDLTFCSDACVKAFKREPINFLKEGVKCPICNHVDGRKDISTTHDGTKYYFCNEGCKVSFKADTQKYLDKYNK